MNHRGPPGAEPAGTLALFPSDAAWARTRVLDAQAIETCDFDLDAFARFRRIRILTYSSSVQMLHTVLERFAESRVECVLGYSRVVSNVASIIALQTAAIEEVHNVLRGLPASSRDDVLERVREGRLQVPGGRRPRLAREDLPPLRRTRRRSVRADRLGQLLHLRAARRSARGAHPLSRRPRLGRAPGRFRAALLRSGRVSSRGLFAE